MLAVIKQFGNGLVVLAVEVLYFGLIRPGGRVPVRGEDGIAQPGGQRPDRAA